MVRVFPVERKYEKLVLLPQQGNIAAKFSYKLKMEMF